MKTRSKKRKGMSLTADRRSTKLTSKYQATIPIAIRKYLHLKKGDEIVYELLSDGIVVVRKATPLDLQYLQALNSTLTEWESEDDEQAYKNL